MQDNEATFGLTISIYFLKNFERTFRNNLWTWKK